MVSLFNSHASYLGQNLTRNIVDYEGAMNIRRFSILLVAGLGSSPRLCSLIVAESSDVVYVLKL